MIYDLSKVLFKINNHQFTRQDFLDTLKFHQLADDWLHTIHLGELAKQHALNQNTSPDSIEINNMSKEFRYSQKLLTTEEFNDWLITVDLSINDFEDYLLRTYWREKNPPNTAEPSSNFSHISTRQLFAELYFSGSFEKITQSWQQRLLAWCDSSTNEFPDNQTLEENFISYKEKLKSTFNEEAWFNCKKNELISYELELADNEILSVLGKDLPKNISELLIHLIPGELFGPISAENNSFSGKLLNKKIPDKNNPEIASQLFTYFSREVWKTLEVKYVR